MNKQIKIISAVVVLFLNLEEAFADSNRVRLLNQIQPRTYYTLTSAAAKALDISLENIITKVQLQNTQSLVFQASEDGEIDLSIYEKGVFSQLRADVVM